MSQARRAMASINGSRLGTSLSFWPLRDLVGDMLESSWKVNGRGFVEGDLRMDG